ncbi:MAG TPA: SEC-C metal-binding domain-containing protein [Pseudolabrys sp.]|nr:SEC-C metal-binding domain-containing protein [Pseudolabrys sp.]
MTFVTGANDKYFFMCGMLLESLHSCFPGIPCRVMDFGLSEPRRKFFIEKKLLLDIPAGLNKTDHPYKLKSGMASFLADEPASLPVWIDCDIVAVRPAGNELLDLAGELVAQNKIMAMSTDEGPNKTLASVCNSYNEAKLRAALAADPSLGGQRCLNAGVVVFANRGALENWQAVAAAQDGDMFPDQNALNIMCYRNPDRVTVLDARIWNVHAGLLKSVNTSGSDIGCDDVKPIFAHATSAFPGDIMGGVMPISAKDLGCEAFLRFFTNGRLRSLQENYLTAFLRTNFELLRDLGILVNVSPLNARRNDPCPCGSGKKFKHCHGADA